MRAARAPLVVCAPCDTPYLPTDLVARLHAAFDAHRADIAMAVTVDAQHARSPQPTFALLRTSLADDLAAALAAGERKVRAWYARHKTVEVEFRDERAFYNATPGRNSPRWPAADGIGRVFRPPHARPRSGAPFAPPATNPIRLAAQSDR